MERNSGTIGQTHPPHCPHDVTSLIRNHNREAKFMVIVYALGALIAWIVSYLGCWLVFTIIRYFLIRELFGTPGPWWSGHAISILVMVLLLWELKRGVGDLFNTTEYANSIFSVDREKIHVGYMFGFPLTRAYVALQFLLVAPRATQQAISHYRSICSTLEKGNTQTVQSAVQALWRTSQWMDPADLRLKRREIITLQKAGVIWVSDESGGLRVRLNPSLCR